MFKSIFNRKKSAQPTDGIHGDVPRVPEGKGHMSVADRFALYDHPHKSTVQPDIHGADAVGVVPEEALAQRDVTILTLGRMSAFVGFMPR